MQAYLTELDSWVRYRKDELDELDAAALPRSPRKDELTDDMTLSMALWKAVADRLQLLLAVWDGGRVLEPERERLATLIHGRLDATLDPAVLAKSATEPRYDVRRARRVAAGGLPAVRRAGRAAAPAARPRSGGRRERRPRQGPARLARPAARPGRPRARRRSRPRAQRTWDELAARIKDVTERLQRGGDVGGLLGPLENDTALFERDLIVGGAERRDTRDRAAAAAELREDLLARSAALEQLAARCVEAVDPAPNYAVPDVEALGPVPGLAARPRRLPQPPGARRRCHEPRPRVVRRRPRRPRRPGRAARRARAEGVRPGLVVRQRDLAGAEATAREVLARRPCPVAVATALVDAYAAWLTHAATPQLQGGPPMKCQQPGCTGTIVDGYCDVCGMAPAEGARRHAGSTGSRDRR